MYIHFYYKTLKSTTILKNDFILHKMVKINDLGVSTFTVSYCLK